MDMNMNMNQAGKSGSPPAVSSSYLNIAAFGCMPYPVPEDMYTDYFNDSMIGNNNERCSAMRNTQENYYEVPDESDNSSFQQQQIYQCPIQHGYQSAEPSIINTPGTLSIAAKFEDPYDNLNLSWEERSTRRLSSNIHSRRRAQNRASQRAFRERKEQHVKEVEAKLAEVEAKYESLKEKYRANKQELEHLKAAMRNEPSAGDEKLYSEMQFDTFLKDIL